MAKEIGLLNKWHELSFNEAVIINPPVKLEKGRCYPFVDMSSLNPGSRWAYATEERVFNGSGSRFQYGDTLMARITPCLENGKISRFHSAEERTFGFGSTEFIVIRGRKEYTDNDFVYYLTCSDIVRYFAIAQMRGTSGRQRVPVDAFKCLRLRIPPIAEQKAIAHTLGTLDDKIELNRKMNETLEQMARALFKSWFIDFEPVRAKMEGRWKKGQSLPGLPAHLYDLFPDRLVPTELGEIPELWAIRTLGDVADVNWGDTNATKKSYIKNGFPAYSAKGPDGFLPYYDYNRVGVVLSAIGANAGYTWLALGKWSCIKNTIRFWCTDENLSTEYLFHATKGNNYWPIRGSAQPFISQEDAKNVKIILPCHGLGKLFGDLVRPLYEKIFKLKLESDTIGSIRDILLPKLINGEISIKNAEKFLLEEGL